jgi:hypothetical protein
MGIALTLDNELLCCQKIYALAGFITRVNSNLNISGRNKIFQLIKNL